MLQVTTNFVPRLRAVVDRLSTRNITAKDIANRSRERLPAGEAFTATAIGNWKTCATVPSVADFRSLVKVLDSYAALEADRPISPLMVDELIASYGKGTRADLFRTSHEFIESSTTDTPIAALLVAILQSPDIALTSGELEKRIKSGTEPHIKPYALKGLLGGTAFPTGEQTRAILNLCNRVVVERPGAVPLSPDEIDKVVNVAEGNIQNYAELDMSPSAQWADVKRKVSQWLDKQHIVSDVKMRANGR